MLKTILCLGLLSQSLYGSIVEVTGTPVRTLSVSDVEVPIYQQIKLKLASRKEATRLYLTGAGVRTKKVLVVTANVYTAQSYLDSDKGFTGEPLEILKKSGARVLKLSFLRDVGAEKIKNSFAEALEVNGIDPKSPSIAPVLAKFTFDIKVKEELVFIGFTKNSQKEGLIIESSHGSFDFEGNELATQFWKIWFGIPADGGLEKLKADLLGQRGSEAK